MRALRVTGAILAAFVVVIAAATPSGSGNKASEAEVHLRKACEVVWTAATDSQIERCTRRAMAAMGDENRLRDNELKRFLMSSERELEDVQTRARSGARQSRRRRGRAPQARALVS